MNRRDALKSLLTLPAVNSVRVADVKSEDTIVIECDQHLSMESQENLRRMSAVAFPGSNVVVLTGGAKLSVVRK